MVKKQTRRSDIEAYGIRGIEIFDQIEIKVKELVEEAASVEYNGGRARDFKETCAGNAVEFGVAVSSNMQNMAEAISGASSFIAQNLGGQPIDLEPPTVVISMPQIVVDEELETADSSILTTLQDNCNRIYGEVSSLYDDHLSDFTNLGNTEAWVGPEYEDALGQIQKLTDTAKAGVEESRNMMSEAITSQMADLNM